MVQLYGRNLYCLTLRLTNWTNQFRLSQYYSNESDVMWRSVGCFYPTPQKVIRTCAELNEIPSNISTMIWLGLIFKLNVSFNLNTAKKLTFKIQILSLYHLIRPKFHLFHVDLLICWSNTNTSIPPFHTITSSQFNANRTGLE